MNNNEPNANDNALDLVRNKQYDEALIAFRNKQYGEALIAFQTLIDSDELDDLKRLCALGNIVTCMFELKHSNLDDFLNQIDHYLELLPSISQDKISPKPCRDLFSYLIQFLLDHEAAGKSGSEIGIYFQRFLQKTQPKLKESDYVDIWKQEIDRERRNVARGDYATRCQSMIHALLDILGPREAYACDRAALYNLLADLTYFAPSDHASDNERFRQVLSLLEKALEADPHNLYALHYKNMIQKLASTNLQIRRFNHDTQSRLGNVRVLIDRLRNSLEPGDPRRANVLTLAREIEAVIVIGQLVKSEQPSQWSTVHLATLLGELLEERGWPQECIERASMDQGVVEMCTDMTRLALDNIMRNTDEAYKRNHLEPPPCPCRLSWLADKGQLIYRDFASGIDPALGNIFEPYKSSKGVYDNVGLGLTQAREAMTLQGFDLQLADPQPAGGATFVITFKNMIQQEETYD